MNCPHCGELMEPVATNTANDILWRCNNPKCRVTKLWTSQIQPHA